MEYHDKNIKIHMDQSSRRNTGLGLLENISHALIAISMILWNTMLYTRYSIFHTTNQDDYHDG
jgi:hypothetical protein